MTKDLYPDLAADHHGPDGGLPTPRTALAIGAHPDDIEFGAGGTLARWAKAGSKVTMLVMTDGSKGSWDPDVVPAELARLRRAEQQAAAAVLGAVEVVHLDHVDGELEYTMALRRQLCHQIRRHTPEVVLSHDPWQRYQLHPDHRATGMAVVDGVVAARDHLFFPTPDLPPHRPKAILLWSPDEPDHHEPIASSLDTKIDALLCHSSQGTTTMGGAESDEDARARFVARMIEWAERSAEGSPHHLAEVFKRLTP